VPLYILAGGRSRRFGSDKARALHDGVPLVVAVARELAPMVGNITVVASRDGEYDDLGLRSIGDIVPGLGPLGGLATAFADAGSDWLLLCACDWVGLRREWLQPLLARRRGNAGAIVYRGDRYEPMLGLYHTSLAATVRARLDSGDRSMQSLLDCDKTITLPVPPDWGRARNLNRPSSHPQKKNDGRGGTFS
jgi:molybdopterin-guanine dinucleotide biosynthesis protein A